MLSEESLAYEFLLWVQVVQHDVCVARVACSKNNYLEAGGYLFEEAAGVGSDVYPSDSCLTVWEFDW